MQISDLEVRAEIVKFENNSSVLLPDKNIPVVSGKSEFELRQKFKPNN